MSNRWADDFTLFVAQPCKLPSYRSSFIFQVHKAIRDSSIYDSGRGD
jgi:hypothetical protein